MKLNIPVELSADNRKKLKQKMGKNEGVIPQDYKIALIEVLENYFECSAQERRSLNG